MNHISKYILLAALPLLPLPLLAQEHSDYNESVVVKGSYTPVIEMSEKLNFPARLTDTIGKIDHSFSYSITPLRLKALYEPSRIKAARLVGEPSTKLYNNYVRLGFGNYYTPLLDAYLCSTRDRRKTYGLRFNHLSSWGSLDRLLGYGKAHFGQTDLTLFGKYILADKIQLSSDLSYSHDHNLLYGFSDSTLAANLPTIASRSDIPIADYRSSFNNAVWDIGLRNMQLDPNKLGYSADLRLEDLWASWGQNEFHLNLAADAHYGFAIRGKYKGVAYLHAEWDGFANRFRPEGKMPLGYSLTPSTDTLHAYRNTVKLNPYVDFTFSGLSFHVGLLSAWDAYSHPSQTTAYLFPDLLVSKKLMKESLVLAAGATGNLEANSLNHIRSINPYLEPNSPLLTTRHNDFFLRSRWSVSKKMELNAALIYSLLRDDLSFSLSPSFCLNNVFRPQYSDLNRLTLGADLSFVNDEMLTLRAGGHYYHYSLLSHSQSLLYRPNWDALVAADVNYHDKWLLHLEGRLLGSMEADLGEHLPMRYGVAAEVEYRHNRALSFFLRADNIAFQRYYLWQNYPSYRGLFILGLTYTIN